MKTTTLTDLNEITGEVETHRVRTCSICGEEAERGKINRDEMFVCQVCVDDGLEMAVEG